MIFNEYSIVCPFYHHFDGESSFFGQSRSESFRLQTSAVLRHNLGWMDIGEAQLPSPTTNGWGDFSGIWERDHQKWDVCNATSTSSIDHDIMTGDFWKTTHQNANDLGMV